jgi:hypothetical protein
LPLREEDRSAILAFDQCRDQQEQWREQQQSGAADDDIDKSLDEFRAEDHATP